MFGTGFKDYENHVFEQRWRANVTIFGVSESEAKKAAKQEVHDAIAQSKAEGWYGLGPIGEQVLQRYKSEAQYRKGWEAMKAAGVRDEDVIEWWNIPDFERRLMLQDDDVMRTGGWMAFVEEGKTWEQAALLSWKALPVYGDPLAPPTFPDDPESTMLPVEMKLRYIRWSEEVQSRGEGEAMKKEQGSRTMNEYVRHLARQGRL
jgi:hypothetical protein